MFERSLLTDRDVEQLRDAVLDVLEKVGALYQNAEILKALDAAGAKVDHQAEVARFPKAMVREFVEALRKESPKADDAGHRRFSACGQATLSHQLCQYVYDYEKREKRIGNKEDYVKLLQFGDALHGEQGVGHCLLLSDVAAPVEPLEVTLLQFEHVRKPKGAYVQDMRQVDYLKEIEQISGVEGLHWLANCGFSSPLRFGKDIAERFVYKMKHDGPANLYIMTMSGAGTPVTTAGCIVIGAAEFMANWIAGRALNPNAKLSAGSWIATMDMHSGEASYHAPDAVIRNLGLREFMRRWTGMTTGAGSGEYGPAKVPSLYATLEKAYRAMTLAAFTGSNPGIGSGHLDGGLTISPVQLLLDREMSKALDHLAKPIEVNADTIGLDTIIEVAHGTKANYLETDHTLRHFRSAVWLPEFMERPGWVGPETEERVLNRAQKKVNELIAAYKPPDVDKDKLAKIRAVVERARKRLS